jgi:multicomponent Na+:H+ antiporter subunit D
MVVGGFLALGQTDIKRLFAYSSISQIGYIFLCLGIATPLAFLAGLFHLFNHSIFKSLLFLNSGAIEYSTGTRDLRKMGGLISKMPLTANTNIIGSMSISGIPPLNGFWSKLLIILACIQAGHYILAIIAVLVSILTLAYYLKALKGAFFGAQNLPAPAKKVPLQMQFSMAVLALICIIGGLVLIPNLSNLFLKPAVDVLLLGKGYANAIFGAVR